MGTRYHFDELEKAVFEYLSALDAVDIDIGAIIQDESWPQSLVNAAQRLRHAARKREFLLDSDKSDLDSLLSEVVERVAQGTSRIFVHDENCMSGGWYESHVTREAEALWERSTTLRQLQQCHAIVAQIVRAESLSCHLRT